MLLAIHRRTSSRQYSSRRSDCTWFIREPTVKVIGARVTMLTARDDVNRERQTIALLQRFRATTRQCECAASDYTGDKDQPSRLRSKRGGGYERETQTLLAWREITDVKREKQAIVITLSLPEGRASGVREKVFDELDIGVLKTENGFILLAEFLDLKLGKDDLAVTALKNSKISRTK